jgi:hypothetical protein
VSQVYSEGVTALLRIEARWDGIEKCAADRRGWIQSFIHAGMQAMPRPGLLGGVAIPTGLDHRQPPSRRGHAKPYRRRSLHCAPLAPTLTGWRRAVGWSKCLV